MIIVWPLSNVTSQKAAIEIGSGKSIQPELKEKGCTVAPDWDDQDRPYNLRIYPCSSSRLVHWELRFFQKIILHIRKMFALACL